MDCGDHSPLPLHCCVSQEQQTPLPRNFHLGEPLSTHSRNHNPCLLGAAAAHLVDTLRSFDSDPCCCRLMVGFCRSGEKNHPPTQITKQFTTTHTRARARKKSLALCINLELDNEALPPSTVVGKAAMNSLSNPQQLGNYTTGERRIYCFIGENGSEDGVFESARRSETTCATSCCSIVSFSAVSYCC